MDQTSTSVLLRSHRNLDHTHAFILMPQCSLTVSSCEGWTYWWMSVCVCACASVMIALSYVKMSSCPSVPTSRPGTPSSDTQQAELIVVEEGSRWKVQADVCVPVFLSAVFFFAFFPLTAFCLFNLDFLLVALVFFYISCLSCLFMFCSSASSSSLPSFCPGLNHRAWWPWERPGPGPQEQDLLPVWSPEEGGQRPSSPWGRELPGGMEECRGLCRQNLRQGTLSQRSLHRTSLPTLEPQWCHSKKTPPAPSHNSATVLSSVDDSLVTPPVSYLPTWCVLHFAFLNLLDVKSLALSHFYRLAVCRVLHFSGFDHHPELLINGINAGFPFVLLLI